MQNGRTWLKKSLSFTIWLKANRTVLPSSCYSQLATGRNYEREAERGVAVRRSSSVRSWSQECEQDIGGWRVGRDNEGLGMLNERDRGTAKYDDNGLLAKSGRVKVSFYGNY